MRPEVSEESGGTDQPRPTGRRAASVTLKLAVLAALGALTAVVLLPGSAGGAPAQRKLITSIPTTILLPQFYTLSVSVAGGGSVTSSPSGIDCGATCSALFTKGTSVTLTAKPNSVLYSFTGWGGACSGTGDCTVSAGASVSASFALRLITTIITTPILTISSYSLTVSTTGSGSVSSTASGISCPGTCTASFGIGTSVVLHATPSSGYAISSWSGDGCSGTSSSCTVTGGGTVNVTFSQTSSTTSTSTTTTSTPTTTSSAQPIIVATPATSTPIVTTPLYTVTVGATGTGTVTGKAPGSISSISCGAKGSRCFGTFKPGTTITLAAAPAAGFSFGGWSGGCKGKSPTCTLHVTRATTVSANFTSKPSASIVPLVIETAAFSVQWHESVGTGKLMVHGRIAKSADVQVELDRSSGQKLVSERLSLPAGSFSLALKLDPGLGLLPGGFVVTISGKSGDLSVPPQVKTLTLPAPVGGVVYRAFASSSPTGPPVETLHKSKEAFVTFDFGAQPMSASRSRSRGSCRTASSSAPRRNRAAPR